MCRISASLWFLLAVFSQASTSYNGRRSERCVFAQYRISRPPKPLIHNGGAWLISCAKGRSHPSEQLLPLESDPFKHEIMGRRCAESALYSHSHASHMALLSAEPSPAKFPHLEVRVLFFFHASVSLHAFPCVASSSSSNSGKYFFYFLLFRRACF